MKKLLLTLVLTLFTILTYAQTIGIVGDFNNWSGDINMSSNDNVNWTLSHTFTANTALKFRQNASWDVNWGSGAFPSGTGVQNGNNIPVPAGTYTISFNSSTGAYNFQSPAPIVTYDVTFSVDMSQYTGSTANGVFLNGTFNSWCGSCNPMTHMGNGIWQVTIPLTAATIEYKFTIGGWDAQENLISGSSCTVTNWGYTNRSYTVAANAVLPTVCWNSCTSCQSAPATYNTTFSVDMSQYTGSTANGVFVNGSFNGWCGSCNPMTDMGSGIWQTTLPLPAGAIEYKFTVDGWNAQENLVSGSSCTVTNSGFTNRSYTVSAVSTIPTVCWNSCTSCQSAPATYNTTFSVDMSQYTGSTANGVFVNGSFNGWCGTCNALTDMGNGIWQTTLPLPAGSIEYKFTVDGWNDSEQFAGGESCTVTTGGFTNRSYNVSAVSTVPTVCWNSCSACVPIPCEQVAISASQSSVCAGESVTLTANGASSYLWNDGTTGSVKTVVPTSSTVYSVVGSGPGNCTSTTEISISVTPLVTPTFNQVAAICAGATLSALPSYSTNGISGTWSPSMNNQNTTLYTFTPASGSCINQATMTIVVNAAPVLTTNTNILCSGVPVVITSSVSNGLSWQKATTANGSYTTILNQTASTYTPTTAGFYRAVSSQCPSLFSSSQQVTTGVITSSTPSATAVGSASACVGGTVTLSATTSVANPSYQWFKGTTAVAGATFSTLTLSPMSSTLAGSYNVKVAAAGQCLSAASSSIAVTAVALPATPTISLVGSTYAVLCGAATNGTYATGVTLKSSVAPTASTVTPVVATLQWYKDGQAIAGATAQNYVATQAGSYQVQVTNPTTGCTGLMSAARVVTVGVVPSAPTATASGATLLCGTGAQVTLSSSVAASGSATTPGSITLQWYKSVTNATTGVTTVTTIPAASFGTNQAILLAGSTPTGSTNALSGITYSGTAVSGSYTVRARLIGGCLSDASNAISATYSVLPAVSNVTTTITGASTVLCVGNTISLKSSVAASATVLVQWYKNGQLIPGATGTNYIASTAGSYTVITSNVAGCSAAAGTALVLTQGVAAATPVITASGSTTLCGSTTAAVQLTSSVAAQAGTTLQWYKNGAAVTGGTATTLNVLNTATNAGSYTVKVLSQAGGCPSALSAETVITTGTAPTTTPTITIVTSTGVPVTTTTANVLSNTTPTIYLKSSVVPVTGTATVAPVILKWYKDGVEMTSTVNSGLTNQIIAVTSAGSYRVRAFYGTSLCPGIMSLATVITGTSPLGIDLNNNEEQEDATSKLDEELVWDAAVSRNPYEQYVTIRLNSESDSDIELTMVDAMGKVVSHEVANIKELGSTRIGEGLTPGMYLISIRQDENIKTIRVIKQ